MTEFYKMTEELVHEQILYYRSHAYSRVALLRLLYATGSPGLQDYAKKFSISNDSKICKEYAFLSS